MNSIRRLLRTALLPTPSRFSSAPAHPPYNSLNLNADSDVFNFTPESEKEIEKWLKKYPTNYKKSALIPILFIAQKQNNNFLSLGAMNKVAQVLEIPPIDVYEVASFYTMFNRTKVGKFHLQVCGTTPCMVCGAERIIKVLENHLGIHVGETTPDMMFTLSEVECLGACVNAPMLQINNEWVYEDLTESNIIELVEKLRRGEEVKKGPQNHRRNSEGPQGRTSLNDVEKLWGEKYVTNRDFGKAKEDWIKAKEAADKAAAEKAAADKAAKEKAEAEKAAAAAKGAAPPKSDAPKPDAAKAEAEKLAKEKAEKEAKEKAEKAAKEAKEKAEKEAKEKAEKEAKEKAEKEAKEKAAKEKAEKETLEAQKAAKAKADAEAAAKAKANAEVASKSKAKPEADKKADKKAEKKEKEPSKKK